MLGSFTARNIRLFFKDKAYLFVALITPVILLVLYATFLGNVYRDSFRLGFPESFPIPESLLNGFAGAQLVSSLLSVSCVTVAFCANMISVQDKANGVRDDFSVTPVSGKTLAGGYFLATYCNTLIVGLIAFAAGCAYLAIVGWYFTLQDLLLILSDVLLLTLFGASLSSLVTHFLSTQGQISAVGTLVSSMYGFISGAYMPLSQFSPGLRTALCFLPGTYGTALLRTHVMRGVFGELSALGAPEESIALTKDAVDCNLYLFDQKIELWQNYAVLCGAIILILLCYFLLNFRKRAGRN